MSLGKVTAILLFAVAMQSCIPSHLEKYTSRSSRGSSGPAGDITESSPQRSAHAASRRARKSPQDVERPPIYPIDRQTFRMHLSFDDVWDSALNVLLKNYNLTIVDKDSGIITTEWDTFFLSDDVFRNRVSMRIHRVGRSTVDVIVHNNVERLQDSSTISGGGIGSVWLPAEDVGDETNRLVQNMAVALNQPPPNAQSGRVARRPQN